MTDIASALIKENIESHVRGEDASFLNLGNCGITKLPDALFDCQWVTDLNLGQGYWKEKGNLYSSCGKDDNPNSLDSVNDIWKLKNLQHLYISGCDLKNIDALTELIGLQSLDLSNNKIETIDGLKNLNKLKTLNLFYNAIFDLSPLSMLKSLTELNLRSNKITNLAPLSFLTTLHDLDLCFNSINNIDALAPLKKLTKLELCFNEIFNIDAVNNFPLLWYLGCSNNRIYALSALTELPHLTWLRLSKNLIVDIAGLAFLKSIKNLELGDNSIKDISILSKLEALEYLWIPNNKVINVSPLASLQNLQKIFLQDNVVNNISPLCKLTKLKELNVAANVIEVFPEDFLEKLINLEQLNLYGNQITNIPQSILADYPYIDSIKEHFKKQIKQRNSNQTDKISNDGIQIKSKIYFSYAWNNSTDGLVTSLYESLKRDNYNVILDKQNIAYKDLISEFMQEIGRGDFIVVVISDKYLKSDNCMYELYEIYRNSKLQFDEFLNKIYPIRVEKLDLNNPKILDYYLSYWKEREIQFKELVLKHNSHFKKQIIIRDIYFFMSLLLPTLNDINTTGSELLLKDDFAIVKQAIIQKANRVNQ